MISQLETGKYVIVGEAKAHGSLEDMVAFHMKVGLIKLLIIAIYGIIQLCHSQTVIIGNGRMGIVELNLCIPLTII